MESIACTMCRSEVTDSGYTFEKIITHNKFHSSVLLVEPQKVLTAHRICETAHVENYINPIYLLIFPQT